MTSIFLFYAYAVGLGCLVRDRGMERAPGEEYTGGKLMAIMFCTITASFAMGGAG